MSTTNATDFDVSTDDAQLDDRDARALTEYMTVLSDVGEARNAPGMVSVTTESGSEYLVDVRHESCSCPDAEHRDVKCKHIRRAEFATGQRPIPTWADTDAIDPRLGEHVEGGPVMTDGGRLFREQDHGYETGEVDGGVLVYERDSDTVGRRLVGFTAVDDWDAIRSELARRGHGVGAVHQKEVFDPAEVGL